MTNEQLSVLLNEIVGNLARITTDMESLCESEGVFIKSERNLFGGMPFISCTLTEELQGYMSRLQDHADTLEGGQS